MLGDLFTQIPVVGPILDGIASLLGGSPGDSNTQQVATNEVWTRVSIIAGLQFAATEFVNRAVDKIAKTVAAAVGHVIHDLIHGKINHLIQDIIALIHRIHALLLPLITWLRKLQAAQRQIQMQQLKQMIDIIQKIRAFLAILKLFHVGFAAKLDAWLAGVESKIITRELSLAQKTNLIIDWVNLVADPTGLFRFAPWIMSFGRAFDSLLRILSGRGVDYFFVDHAASASPLPFQSNYATYYRNLSLDLAGGTGNVPALRANFAATLATMKARQ